MRRTIFLLFSIAKILYLPGYRSVHGETILNKPGPEVIDIKDSESVEIRPSNKDSYRNKEESSELLGRWRNNGEALEPKWRDGDAVPLLPFSHFARTYSKEEEPDLINHENSYDSLEYRRFGDRGDDYVESYQNGRLPLPEDSRIRLEERKYAAGRNSRGKFEIKQEQMPLDRFSKEKFTRNDRTISNGYRDAFQVRPNEYEHELADEEYLKPRPRKRRPPQNEEFVLNAKEVSMRNERAKVVAPAPSTRIPPVQNSEASTSKKIEAIKSLIKMQQEEGASLSEILRRRNLTLIDLLKGKEDVISALKMEDIDEIGDDIEQISMAMTSTLAKLPSTEKSSLAIQNTIDTTAVTPAIEIDLELSPKMKEITTTTTMKSETSQKVSSPGISIEFDQNDRKTSQNLTRVIDEDEIMEFSDFTDYKKGRTTVSPIWISLVTENTVAPPMRNMNLNRPEGGSTLSIVRILSPTEITYNDEIVEKHRQFDKTYDHDNNNSPSSIDDHLDLSEDDYQYDAPSNDMRQYDIRVPVSMGHDECKNHEDKQKSLKIEKNEERSNELISKSTNDSFSEEMIKTFLENYPNVEDAKSDSKRYEDIVLELEPEARAEIFELFSSDSGKKLQRLLESRNMSLEELIALRQRGSSKVHLAEVSRLRNQKVLRLPEDEQLLIKKQLQEPEEKSLLRSQNETITIKSSVNEMERNINGTTQFVESSTFVVVTEASSENTRKDLDEAQKKDTNLLVEVAEVFKDTSSGDIRKHLNEAREKDSNDLIEVTELFTTFKSLPFGKDHEQGFLENIDETLSGKNIDNESINVVQNDYTKDVIENDLKTNLNTVYDVSTSNKIRDENENENHERSLSKIKSSIIASGAILGVTIVVFLAIFVACRIRHKQKYRYRNSFPRTVFQTPMTTARKLSNTSSLNNIMVNVVATSTTKRSEKNDSQQVNSDYDPKCDIDNDSLDANDSWETIPDYMK